jgi:5-methylthioadenosine/S-adenosylhomocysteine deaminase
VAIKGNQIVALGGTEALKNQYPSFRQIDCSGMLVIPGLIDTHVHTCQQMARGIADEVPGNVWLKQVVNFEALMDEKDVYWSALLACLEMIKSGTTCFVEACANPIYYDAVGEAIKESGIKAILTRSTVEIPDSDWAFPAKFSETSSQAIDNSLRMINKWNGAEKGKIRAWFGWRQIWNVSVGLLREMTQKAKNLGIGIHTHAGTRRTGQIESLEKEELLGPHLLIAHSVRYTRREIELIKNHDVKIVHCPAASMHGAYGSASVGLFPEMLERGVTVSLGCDGAANNNKLDMVEEMRMVALIHKETRIDPNVIPKTTAFRMATVNGARAVGWEDEIGSLSVGKRADIAVVDFKKPHLVPVFDPLSNLVYAANGQDVKTVIIDGEIIMEDRKVLTLNEEEIFENVNNRIKKFSAYLRS